MIASYLSAKAKAAKLPLRPAVTDSRDGDLPGHFLAKSRSENMCVRLSGEERVMQKK